MTEIRKDLFPKMASLFKSKESMISEYVNKSFEALHAQFKSKNDLIQFLNSLDTPQNAELFLKISKFYLISKKYQKTSYIKLIMIISSIERLTTKDKDFMEFHIWLQKQDKLIDIKLEKMKLKKDDFKETIRELSEEYFDVYGSRRNVLDFFENYVSNENKLKLIRSFKGFWTDTIEGFSGEIYKSRLKSLPASIEETEKAIGKKAEKGLMPYCYNWQDCWVECGECYPPISCRIIKDQKSRQFYLKRVVNDLYQLRNDFVHSARVTPLNEEDSVGVLSKIGSNGKPISIQLTTEDLERIFEEGLKTYFDRLVIDKKATAQ